MSDKLLIAIVEDDVSARAAMARLVRAFGYAAAEFEGCEQFLGSDELSRTSVLIADVQMPGMTGLDLHRRLVADGVAIPTVLVTAYPDETLRKRALDAGVACFLGKPFEPDDLLECIRSSLAFHPISDQQET